MLSLISVFLGVVLTILFVRLLPALVAIVTIVWLWVAHPSWLIALLIVSACVVVAAGSIGTGHR
jgi:hypothetical protein